LGKAVLIAEDLAFIGCLMFGLISFGMYMSHPADSVLKSLIPAAGWISLGFLLVYHVSRFLSLKYPAPKN
jgi:hypothetical protein